ncbi:MAG: protein usg [Rhodospirillales bacterium]|nr:protein usg [Rhodospirillales bacterium]
MKKRRRIPNRDMGKMLKGYCLTTAEVLYRIPDYPTLLQSFIWQTLDLPPEYPTLLKFLNYWDSNLDGPIHSVTLASTNLIKPSSIRRVDNVWTLH